MPFLDDFESKRETASTHINVFTERYGKLLEAARFLSNNDQGRAIDLVHDALIEFVRHSPDLHKINNIDGYLGALMRNLFKSQKRRVTLRLIYELSIENCDLTESMLPEIADRRCNPHFLLQAQDLLRITCEFACFCKQRLKFGSVLLLRFFHGYHTSEIALIMGVTTSAVSHQLKIAQDEVCLYLNNPKHFDFYREITRLRSRLKFNYGRLVDDLVGELRRAIFLSPLRPECILHCDLQKLYGSQGRKEIDCETLAHIVSCADCLDTINAFLGLDLLSVRYPTDTLSRRTKGENTSRREVKGLESKARAGVAKALVA